MTVKDTLQRHGFTQRVKWREGMISAHEVMAELGLKYSEARRVVRQLAESGDFEMVTTIHPKTGGAITALIEKRPDPDKPSKSKVQTRV